ncbi:hypothetical protein SAMN03080615_01639 [Amphritea atlantica]|uniref:Phage regulatory protein CII (CP76) n=2 Tax=Amphritea atlantica TaxID=355243 RepID=A0A1H9GES1_9GAMM|nr:hypothetical protein SAMN03080615_01639 [Amphritea atlantica]
MAQKPMTDINDIRLDNTRQLANKHCGSLAKFADRIDRVPTQVSRIIGKNPTKKIGNRLARHIEEKFNKESGWLDQVHREENQQSENSIQEKPALYMALTGTADQLELLRSVIETIETILEEEEIKLSPEEKAKSIIACLQTCVKRGTNLSADKAIAATAIQAVI